MSAEKPPSIFPVKNELGISHAKIEGRFTSPFFFFLLTDLLFKWTQSPGRWHRHHRYRCRRSQACHP